MATFPNLLTPVYITPAHLRRVLGTQAQATNDDEMLLNFCSEASRRIEQYCNRNFYMRYQTILVDWPGTSFILHTPEDLHSIVTLTNGDGNEITETTGTVTNYRLYANNEYPKYKIELTINSGKVFLFTGTPQMAISINALWGFPAIPSTGQYYIATAATVVSAQTATTGTLTVPTGSFNMGDTVLIGTEFEIVQSVTVGVTNDVLTVLRGASGSTAAIHAVGATVNLCCYHPDIVHAAYRLSGYFYRQASSGVYDTIGIQAYGQMSVPFAMPVDIKAILNQYIRHSH